MNDFNKYGVEIPKILLPKKGSDFKAWSVIACDQYTQDRDYWARCEKNAEGKPSCINLILPEVYLNDADKAERIAKIHKNMNEYVENGVFAPEEAEFVYIERKTAYGRVRKGLIVAIDLETYEWKPFSKALIRATEATIVDRIPPRMEIRRGAPLESPHIMLLVNDADKELVEKSGELAKNAEPIYETDLMENSGSIKGYAIKDGAALDSVKAALEKLYTKNTSADGSVFMFAVGDGNHSLATAKAVWDELKEKNGGVKREDGTVSIPEGFENHNARFALTEIVNIYDDGLTFEPIHRVLFNIDAKSLVSFMEENLSGKTEIVATEEDLTKKVADSKADFGFVYENKETGKIEYALLKTEITDLAVSKLQPALDEFLKNAPMQHVCKGEVCQMVKPEIDYIHGAEEVFRLGGKDNGTSILLPPIAKDSFFSTIANNGPLPRKSFSMGEASEKRFYMECRALFN